MDFNANLMINQVLELGVSYRTEGVFVFLIEFLVKDRLRLGYSYDTFLDELSYHNKGSHELLIGFDLPVFKRRMLTPRYF